MSKEKKVFQLEKKEICITSSQIKQAIDLLVNENEILQEENKRLNNIINELEKYIKESCWKDSWGVESVYVKTLLNKLQELKGSDKSE